jgi:MarR family transcriptional regulator, organic hydroperoxide resistance regulator
MSSQSSDADLVRDAEMIEQHLRTIRRMARSTLRADIALGHLTRPQMHALEAIVRHGSLSLKALSRHLALAHSTVSGIVDRLERRGLVRRETDPEDRRGIRILPSSEVTAYIAEALPSRRLGPLLDALRGASAEERARILAGLAALHRLLEERAEKAPAQHAARYEEGKATG